jgi:hypothetical protein
MLERVDSVPWSTLTHAYGPASDVPEQIRQLINGDDKVRERALWELYGNIFHQGTRYQATPYAVPFLYELLDGVDTPGKAEIIYLLVSLALGYEESYLPEGLKVESFRGQLKALDAQMSQSERDNCDRFGIGPGVELDCYIAVRQGVPTLLRLLTDDDTHVRMAAVYALAWFPEDAPQSLPAIQEHLQTESEDVAIANALLALGLLVGTADSKGGIAELVDWLSHPSLIVRTAAAIALARDPLNEQLIDLLIIAVLSVEEVKALGHELRFNEGNLAGYAGLVLASGGSAARDRIIPALAETLKTVNPYQSLDVTRSLLSLIVSGKNQPIRDMRPTSLAPLELKALRAVAEYGGWKIDDAIFVNYCELVRGYGLPDSQAALTKYLAHTEYSFGDQHS